MTMRYLETRGRIHFQSANMVADIMRHFHARQHLGKAVVVCNDPEAMLTLAHKQWSKLSRSLQRHRAGEPNAVEILKLTYTITQMQHVVFAAGPVYEQPEARLFFVLPEQLRLLPANCFSVYVTTKLAPKRLNRLAGSLPAASLLVDYTAQYQPGDFGLRPRTELESGVMTQWRRIEAYLNERQIYMHRLADPQAQTELLDDALDVLIGRSAEFVSLVQLFQYELDLARPLRGIPQEQRREFDALMTLAHRLQAVMPGKFSTQFLDTYADNTFFLNDNWLSAEPLSAMITRQMAAGRYRLAEALAQLDRTPVLVMA